MSAVDFAELGDLESDRLVMPLLTAAHAHALFLEFTNPALYEWISDSPPMNPTQLERRWWRSGDDGPGYTGTAVNLDWAVLRRQDEKVIGKLDAELGPDGVVTNIGYIFAQNAWAHGYGREAVGTLVDKLHASGYREIRAYVTVGNVRSSRLLTELGFRATRILRENDRIRGTLVDDEEYILR